MDTQVIPFVMLIGMASVCSAQSTKTYSDKDLLKNYAFAKCIGMAYSSSEIRKDANASAEGYLEYGSIDFQAYEEAIKLARSYLDKTYSSKTAEPLNMMKCVDLYHSKELHMLVRKYVKK